MTLAQYLRENEISLSAFARSIGTPHGRTVQRYVKGRRIPTGRMMAKIDKATGGAVTASDFFEPTLEVVAARA